MVLLHSSTEAPVMDSAYWKARWRLFYAVHILDTFLGLTCINVRQHLASQGDRLKRHII